MTTSFPPINYPNKPVPPFSAPAPRNPFPGFYPDMWRNITGKPYITVSSKGLANGQSEDFNDGADFGPDSLQSDGSLTQTVGIMEAYNSLPDVPLVAYDSAATLYNTTGKNGTIKLIGTVFKISSPIIFHTTDLITMEGSGQYGGSIPTAGNVSNIYSKTLITSDSDKGCFVIEPTAGLPSTIVGTGMIFIDGIQFDQTVQITSPVISGQPYVVSIGSTSSAYNSLYIGQIDISDESNKNGLLGIFTNTLEGATKIDTLNVNGGTNENAPLVNVTANHLYIGYMPNVTSGAYTSTPNSNSYILYLNLVQDCYIGSVHFYGSGYNGVIYSVQVIPIHIGYLNFEMSSPNVASSPIWHLNGTVNVGALSVNGGYMPYPQDLDNPQYLIVQTYNRTAYGQSVVALFKNDFTVTLPANPPVSGTVYQNTNPYDIEIDLPVYATTSGTAGYVTIAKGSTDTPTAISNQYVSGDTSSTSTQIIRLRVPAGWYYSFTGSGVTFATATPFAE